MITDEGSFASFTFEERYPSLLNELIDQYEFIPHLSEKLVSLKNNLLEIEINQLKHQSPELWKTFYINYEGKQLSQIPFLYAEIYLFALINDIFDNLGILHDPFGFKKQREVVENKEILQHQPESFFTKESSLEKLIGDALSGNSSDLSQLESVESNSIELIIDHSKELCEVIMKSDKINIVLDNIGRELMSDILLAIHLCDQHQKTVTLHFKAKPIFVSDALESDLWKMIEMLKLTQLKKKIKELISANKLVLCDSNFWSAPTILEQYTEDLALIADDACTIVKGDANYRRIFDDREYPIQTPTTIIFNQDQGNIFSIRTMKSEILLGYFDEAPSDPNWLFNGKYGIIQQVT